MQTYCLVIGIMMLILAIVLFIRRAVVLFKGVSTMGLVVGHEVRTSEESTYYLPIVEFIDSKGLL